MSFLNTKIIRAIILCVVFVAGGGIAVNEIVSSFRERNIRLALERIGSRQPLPATLDDAPFRPTLRIIPSSFTLEVGKTARPRVFYCLPIGSAGSGGPEINALPMWISAASATATQGKPCTEITGNPDLSYTPANRTYLSIDPDGTVRAARALPEGKTQVTTFYRIAYNRPEGKVTAIVRVRIYTSQLPTQPSDTFSRQYSSRQYSSSNEEIIVCREATAEGTCTPCTGGWRSCIKDSGIKDTKGKNLKVIGFKTKRDKRGMLRFNVLPPDIRPRAVVFGHNGGVGTISGDKWVIGGPDRRAPDGFFRPLEEAGVIYVAVQWAQGQCGLKDVIGFECAGWFSSPNGDTLRSATEDPAAVMRFVYNEFARPQGLTYGTVGCSAGTLATFGPVYWHGLDQIVAYQFHGSMIAPFNLNQMCMGEKSINRGPGRCENNPTRQCEGDHQCESGQCAFPGIPPGQAKVIDYVHKTNACQSGQFDQRFDQSSYQTTAPSRPISTKIDIKMATGGGKSSDTSVGYTWSAANTFDFLRNREWSTEQTLHCAFMTSASVAERILQGLGISP